MIPAKKFVLAWQSSDSLCEVCKAVGLKDTVRNRKYLTSRASYFRRKGVLLKMMKKGRGRTPLDWAKLAQLAKDVGGEE